MNKLNILWITVALDLVSFIAAAQEPVAPVVVRTKVRADPAHPVHIGENYPAESKRRHEEGVCKVQLTVTADGAIRDVNLTKSTGFPRLDQACLDVFAHGACCRQLKTESRLRRLWKFRLHGNWAGQRRSRLHFSFTNSGHRWLAAWGRVDLPHKPWTHQIGDC